MAFAPLFTCSVAPHWSLNRVVNQHWTVLLEETSRRKERDGHRYPCPAGWFVYGSKQGFGPDGKQTPVENRGNLNVRTKGPEICQ